MRREDPGVERRFVWLLAAALLALLAAGFGFSGALTWMLERTQGRQAGRWAGRLPPEPRLQVDPAAELEALRRREREILTSYAWVDRRHKIVRIPIERAMELTAR